ncbi:MAG: SGNH/GDSL hydrolase family protein [Clostridiaceae bacterium]|nr:SGNH/GDSL hydrolase family protein [Clostridiaceae bacterium]
MGAQLNVPAYYDLAEGDTFELFRRGVVLASDPYRYNWRVECEKGAVFERKYGYTPAYGDRGEYPMVMSLEDDDGTVLDRRETVLRVHAVPASLAKPVNLLCVGDSLTSGGVWVSELARRLTGTGGTPAGLALPGIRFYGGVPAAPGVFHEGYGGWTFESFNTDYQSARFWHVRTAQTLTALDQHASYRDSRGGLWRVETPGAESKLVYMDGTPSDGPEGCLVWESGGTGQARALDILAARRASGNPFWDETRDAVDFRTWGKKVGADTVDLACVLLGWNSTLTPRERYFGSVRTFLANLRRTYPGCRVILMGLQVPDIDGFGQSYGCMWNYMDKLRYVFEMDERYAEIAVEDPLTVSASLAGQFDTEYNMPREAFPANVRNPRPVERGTNGVHPAKEGYLQIADAFYRAVIPFLNSNSI